MHSINMGVPQLTVIEEIFSWTDGEIELGLEFFKVYATACRLEGLLWEEVNAKYGKIRASFIERYPRAEREAIEIDFQKSTLCRQHK